MRRAMKMKMLCPTCHTLETVKRIERDLVYLACGDTRTNALLASHGVSIEAIIANSDDANRLFPVDLRGMVR